MNCLLFVGRLVRRKGLAWFVADVLPALASQHAGLHLAVLGDGPERASIIAAARKAGVRIGCVGSARCRTRKKPHGLRAPPFA